LKSDLNLVRASGTIYIRADGSIDPASAPISTINNVVYNFTSNIYSEIVIERSNIVVDGAGHIVEGTGSGNGLSLYGMSNVTIKNLCIEGFTYGVYLEFASSNVICGNNIAANSYDGIGIYDSSNNIICGNNITANNWFGIGLYYSSNNSIFCNRLANNFDGIRLHYSSNNSISRNHVADNDNGVRLYDSSNNSIFHNNFTHNALQVYSESSFNMWDNHYPSGGNYWSDYNGADMKSGPYQNETGSDGIGDAPYTISESDADLYPLIDPWSLPLHDIAVVEVKLSSNRIYADQMADIKATIRNEGRETETFEVLGFCEDSLIRTVLVSNLTPWQQIVVTLAWNTTGWSPGRDYMISIEAEPVDGEEILENNAKTVTVEVNLMGDINGDRIVNILDLFMVARAFGSRPGYSNWNPMADIDENGKINILDLYKIGKNYGKTY